MVVIRNLRHTAEVELVLTGTITLCISVLAGVILQFKDRKIRCCVILLSIPIIAEAVGLFFVRDSTVIKVTIVNVKLTYIRECAAPMDIINTLAFLFTTRQHIARRDWGTHASWQNRCCIK